MSLSPRLAEIVDALPVRPGMRVLEIGCGTGAAARALCERVGFVLGIDRSPRAIEQATAASGALRDEGRIDFLQVSIEEFDWNGEPFDLAFAVRVGALDGRHPHLGEIALPRIARALKPGGELYLDGGTPLRRVPLPAGT